MPRPPNRNYAFAEAFVEELSRSGVSHACICPGSRSTPLVLSLARNSSIRSWVHLDERSAAYFALGMARALRRAVVLVSTSGTAAANFFPAVVEARYGRAPLLILTADRPPEVWEWGANQTIDQTRIYGSHAKWSANFPPPEVSAPLVRYARAMACRAVSTATEPPAGPVHINFPFGEPLVPETVAADFASLPPSLEEELWQGRGEKPYLRSRAGARRLSRPELSSLAESLRGAERGLIVCGPQADPCFAEAVSLLAHRLSFPLLADPLSQTRCGPHDRSLVIDCYDLLLRERAVAQALSPEVVLRFGAPPTSQPLLSYLAHYRRERQLVIDDGGWPDPIHAASEIVCADPTAVASDLASLVEKNPASEWARIWLELAAAARAAIASEVGAMAELFEGKIFSELADLIPDQALVFAGNSMPVRDLDGFFPSMAKNVLFFANRGASGIDGVTSTALGAGAALGEPVVLVTGDLSFYHDMNGLFAAKKNRLRATIILVNNDGGGIFSFLPQRNYPEFFEGYFGTPHGLRFEAAAALYGLDFRRVASWEEFRAAVARGIAAPGTLIVEVPSERQRNAELHRRVESAVRRAAKTILSEARWAR